MTHLCSLSSAKAGGWGGVGWGGVGWEGRNHVSGWSLQSVFVLEWEPAGIGCRLILRRTKFQIGSGANLSS
jgi:hypothetical protein